MYRPLERAPGAHDEQADNPRHDPITGREKQDNWIQNGIKLKMERKLSGTQIHKSHAGPTRGWQGTGPRHPKAGFCRAASNSCMKPRARRNKDAHATFRLRPPQELRPTRPTSNGSGSGAPGSAQAVGRWHAARPLALRASAGCLRTCRGANFYVPNPVLGSNPNTTGSGQHEPPHGPCKPARLQ